MAPVGPSAQSAAIKQAEGYEHGLEELGERPPGQLAQTRELEVVMVHSVCSARVELP